MIIKSLSRRSGAVGNIVKYVFKNIAELDEHLSPVERALALSLKKNGLSFTPKDLELEASATIEQTLYNATKDMTQEESLNYLFNDFDTNKIALNIEQSIESPYVFTHNLRSHTLEGYIEEFKENNSSRMHKRKDQSVGHLVFSWSGLDRQNINESKVHDMLNKYVELRGDTNLYVGTIHKSTEHVHAHLIISSTQLNGLSSRISKQRFQEIKLEMQEYQKTHYPELSNSLPEHKRINDKGREEAVYQNIKNERAPLKKQLLALLEQNNTLSKDELFQVLEQEQFIPYERRGEITGLQHESGYKFRFSRLGYDLDKVQEVDKQLIELRNLREVNSKGERELDDD